MRLSLFQRFQGGLYAAIATYPGETLSVLPSVPERWAVIAKTVEKLELGKSFVREDWQDLIGESAFLLPWALVPIALFRHDYPQAFRDQLGLLTQANYLTEAEQAAIATWFQVLSLILRERFGLEKWGEAKMGETEEELGIVRQAIAERWSLLQVKNCLPHCSELTQGVFLGLYSWLDTPQHFALSGQRSLRLDNPYAVFFTRIFSGVYNGLTGILLTGYLELVTAQKSDLDWDYLSQTLYRKWLGALSPASTKEVTAIAAHQAMQPRPSLKLISQCESSNESILNV